MEEPKGSGGGDDISVDIGFDLQEAVTQRLAFLSKKTVQLNDLLSATKFTKQEICQMYRGFKQVSEQIKYKNVKCILRRLYVYWIMI